MQKTKKSIISLAIACLICFLCAIGLVLPYNSYAVGEALTVSDDFTAIRSSSESKAYSQSNLVYDANVVHGAVPGSTWDASVSGGDAELVYKLSSDDGYVLSSSTLTFTVGSGHGGGAYWYNAERQGTSDNVLGANLIVYVSTDNETWTSVYNLHEKEKAVEKAQDYFNNKYTPSIDLSDYLINTVDLYVKFDIQHFTVDECCVDTWTGIPLSQVGLGMYSVSITAEQEKVSSIVISSDFTTAGLTAASNNVYEYNNLVTDTNGHLTYGLVPAEKWADKVKILSNAYVTYKLKAVNGYAISSLKIDLDVAFGHNQIVLQVEKTDTVVAISYDNVSYTDIYSLYADETAVAVGETEPKGAGIHEADKRYELSLDLSDKITGSSELYVRIKVCSPNYDELTETSLTVDSDNNKLLPLGQIGSRLYSVGITADQSKIPSVTLTNNWGNAGAITTFDGVVDYNGVEKDAYSGNTAFGLIPSTSWGDPVNISTGYVTYKISATDTYVFNSLMLNLELKFGSNNESFKYGNVDLNIYIAYDGINFTKAYSLYENVEMPSSQTAKTISVDFSSVAKNYGVLYVKLEMVCPETMSVNLHELPICLQNVEFNATQASVVANVFSFSNEFGNDKGTALTANYINVSDSSGVYDGNATFALIPSAGWDGTVNAGDGYITFKLDAPSDKSFNNVRMQLLFKLLSGANVIVSTSYDGSSFTEFFNVVDDLSGNPYNNNLLWTKGVEQLPCQLLDVDLKAVAESSGTLYVKVEMKHPSGSCILQALLCEIFSVRFSGNYSEYSANVGRIIYSLDGGSYVGEQNPETFTTSDGIITLINPVQRFKEFKGWYDNPEFTGDPITTIDSSIIAVHRLYAKWEQATYDLDLRIEGTGSGVLFVDENETQAGIKKVDACTNVNFALTANSDSLIYSLSIDGVDVFLTNGTNYTLRNIDKNAVIIATFNERATIYGDFYNNYKDNVKYGNKWKNSLYDFANLYITDDDRHELGINGGQGYITYKFQAPDGKYFESATLSTCAKLFDNYLLGDVEKVDYYLSYDNVDYDLIYKSEFNRQGENYVTVVQNLTEYVFGKQTFFLKIELGSNSTNWTLLRDFDIKFTYETVELSINYGGFYTDVYFDQLNGKPFVMNLISAKDGYVVTENVVYTDASYTTALDLTENIMTDMTLYVKAVEADGKITYHLDGGVNAQGNPIIYNSNSAIIFAEPTKDGFTFAGWYTDSDYTNLITEISIGRTGDIDLYAKWISNTLPDIEYFGTITYVLNGGTNASGNPDKYLYGDTITFANATKDGYTFMGWYLDQEFNSAITEITASTNGNLTLYAKWQQNAQGGGCGGSFDTGIIVAIVVLIAGVALVLKKKYGRN